MSIENCRMKAAQAWYRPTTEHLAMIPELAEEFAKILNEIWEQAWLGNATTEELIDEIKARIGENGLKHRTVDEEVE